MKSTSNYINNSYYIENKTLQKYFGMENIELFSLIVQLYYKKICFIYTLI